MILQVAQKALISRGDAILLVRKSLTDPEFPEFWDLPGGRVNVNESLDEAIVREVQEETGFLVAPGGPVDCWDWTMRTPLGMVHVVAIARSCEIIRWIGRATRPEDHIEEVKWVDLSDLGNTQLIPSQLRAVRSFCKIPQSP